jgi:hypothetical protein
VVAVTLILSGQVVVVVVVMVTLTLTLTLTLMVASCTFSVLSHSHSLPIPVSLPFLAGPARPTCRSAVVPIGFQLATISIAARPPTIVLGAMAFLANALLRVRATAFHNATTTGARQSLSFASPCTGRLTATPLMLAAGARTVAAASSAIGS